VKRKTRRHWKKKIVAFLAPFEILILLFYFLKESIVPILIPVIKSWFSLDDESKLAIPILYSFFFIIIAFTLFALSRLYLSLYKPNKKYFNLINFEKPTDDVIKKALEGILNSEKTKPYFVHVAPINDEIEQLYKTLDKKGFVWVNGKPGDGKTLLAYHALYKYRKRIGVPFRFIPLMFFYLKYKIYSLAINRITDENEIDQILDELDELKGGRRKIILIDDAHKLSFEDKLRYEFEEEAKEKLSGKFIWINTNYLETKKSEYSESINIDFENFYPKFLNELYQSQNPIICELIKNKCTGIEEAKKQKHNYRIKDPWHFNFIATNGEQRIIQLLEKLSCKKEEQDILLLSLFLFSVRNVITGEKEINQTGFTNLLTSIDIPYFKKIIETYKPNKIISDLASQDKGRFLIIENRNLLDRGFLQAPHYKLSIAIIKSITNLISDQELIKQMIDVSKLLLTNDFSNYKYFGIYFNSLGKYQEYFLNKNKDWIKSFLTNLIIEQLNVYPFLISVLSKKHNKFFKELITDEYFNAIAQKISLAIVNKFAAIQQFIGALRDDRKKLIEKLDWEKLSKTANKADVAQLHSSFRRRKKETH